MSDPQILFGIETEIGITRDGVDAFDVVAESIELVRSVTAPGVRLCWDYAGEDPHADMRGFRVRELRQDVDEGDYDEQDARRAMSFAEIKSDVVLGNGARFYNDHAHPEYSTPECSLLSELSAHDRAGERILMACARYSSARRGVAIRLYKNNTDFSGHSYGCHENYLLPRALPWERLVRGVQAFLVTRQIFAGAGKFGVEQEDRFVAPDFQIAQRSDFFSELQSVDTMQRRPLINTRDEPHADPKRFRRFHVILGDANMSPFATRLKVGATALVLEALVRNSEHGYPVLADPLATLPAISRDPSFRWELTLAGSKPSSAIEVQRQYLAAVRQLCDLSSAEKLAVVTDWETVLNDLEADYRCCGNRLDWVAKLALVHEFQTAQNLSANDPWLQALDLEYHRLDLAEGLYYGFEQSGAMVGVPEESAVNGAMLEPPATTRALVRGHCVQKFAKDVVSAQWDHITLRGRNGPIKISLLDLFASPEILRYGECINQAKTPDELWRLIAG